MSGNRDPVPSPLYSHQFSPRVMPAHLLIGWLHVPSQWQSRQPCHYVHLPNNWGQVALLPRQPCWWRRVIHRDMRLTAASKILIALGNFVIEKPPCELN